MITVYNAVDLPGCDKACYYKACGGDVDNECDHHSDSDGDDDWHSVVGSWDWIFMKWSIHPIDCVPGVVLVPCSRLSGWFSLRCLVRWMYHLHPVWGYTVRFMFLMILGVWIRYSEQDFSTDILSLFMFIQFCSSCFSTQITFYTNYIFILCTFSVGMVSALSICTIARTRLYCNPIQPIKACILQI